MGDNEQPGGLGPIPRSPEHDESPPEAASQASVPTRSSQAPDWWQPGMSMPPQAVAPQPIHVEKGHPVAMREMQVGEILDAAIKFYRASWRIFLGVSAVVIVPLSFIQAFLTRSTLVGFHADRFPERRPTEVIVAAIVFPILSFLFVAPLLTGLFARVTSEMYLGRDPQLSETFRFALSRMRSILLVTLLTTLALLGGLILLIIPVFLFYVRFAFAPATVVVEDVRGRAALRRSWRLAKGHFWRLFGTLVLASIIANIVGGIASIPFTLGAQFIGPSAWPLVALGSSLAGIITRPFALIIVVLLYFDLRIRREGFDLAIAVGELADP